MSIEIIFPDVTILLATCDHPPGLQPISSIFELFFMNLNFLFSSTSLNADLDL